MEPHHNEENLLFKGENIHCRKNPLFEGLGDSLVYRGYFKKANDPKEEIVVRKIEVIDCCDKWKDIFDIHTGEKNSIKHDNVLKIIGCEEKNEWRYFALERYDATLEQFCRGIYKGPKMPSDAQVLCQIAEGLFYLHEEQCTHGNLTPRTILIASSQPVRMMIKLSEFGLSKFGVQCDEELGEKQEDELCQMKYWRIDGTTEINQNPTPNQDIFAAGCICFYFLKRGVHPFGDDSSSILENIKQRNPVNLLNTKQQEKDIWEFAYEPIKNMIGDPPTDGKNWLMIAKKSFKKALPLRFEEKKENELGRGAFGFVYRGTFEGNAVAVKVTEKVDLDDKGKQKQKRETEEHLPLDHENVLKLLHVDDSRDKTYLVLELCAGTLKDYCEDKYNGPELPPDGIVLYQIANGLHYIHSQDLVHRDVKPNNILISMTTPVKMKLSDFGFVKKKNQQGIFSESGLKGTEKYMAPEILELLDKSSSEKPKQTSDTFAAGCVFFYFLTRGKHPFDEPIIIRSPSKKTSDEIIKMNILEKNPKALIDHKENLQLQGLYELIRDMIKPEEERISLPEVIKQLTANLDASRPFKKSERSVSGKGGFLCLTRFHPKKPVLACSVDDKVIFLSADNWSIPFSNWKKKKEIQLEDFETYKTIEWIAGGNQLAAIAPNERDVIVWSYPSGEILFQKKLDERVDHIKLNAFRPNLFAVFQGELFLDGKVVFLFNSCPVVQRSFHFWTIKSEKMIENVQWISENRVALGLWEDEGIEIWEIDELTTSAKKVKQFQYERHRREGSIRHMACDERTKCLACSHDGKMTIWSMDSNKPIHVTEVDGKCWSLAWRPNGKPTNDEGVLDAARKSDDNFILACGFGEGKIVIWTRLDSKEKTRILYRHSRWVSALSFSPDGRFLASAGCFGRELIIWSAEKWEPVYIGEEGSIRHKSFSWLLSPSTYLTSEYKLTFDSYGDKVHVVEYAVGQSKISSRDGSSHLTDCQGIKITRGEWSIGSSGDLK